MPSKTSFFNKTLYLKNLTRFWPLWAGASLLGSLTPLALLMQMIREGFPADLSEVEVAEAYYSVLTGFVPAVCLVYAVLCALVVWSYLFNSRSVSLFHTLPLSRRGLFFTNILSGLTMMVIPFAVTGLLCVLVTAAAGAVAPGALLVTVLAVLGECLFYFAGATLIAFLTGSGAAMAGLYFIFHFLAVGLEYLFSNLASGFYFGVNGFSTSASQWLSPTVALYEQVHYSQVWDDTAITASGYGCSVLTEVHLENGWIIALYALVGVGLLALSWLLYARRRSECAGDVVAAGWMKPVFRYGVALCAALTGGILLYEIFWRDYQDGDLYDFLPMLICMLLGGILGYYIASMLLAKSLRVFRHTWKGAVITLCAAAVLCGAAALDVLGVENRVPDPSEVEAVWLYCQNVDGIISDEASIRRIVEVHQAVLAEKKQFLENENRAYGEDGWEKASFHVEYRLKNGQGLSRSYYLDYPLPNGEEHLEGAMGLMADLVSDPAIQRTNLLRDDIDRFTGGELECWMTKESENGFTAFDAETARLLYEAIRRDIDAGHMGRTAFRSDGMEIYSGALSLYYQTKAVGDGTPGDRPESRTLRLQLSVYCTETLDVLKSEGVLNESRRLLTVREQDQLYEDQPQWEDEYWDTERYAASVVYPEDSIVYADGSTVMTNGGENMAETIYAG